jgi:hypothetical protein
MSCDGVGRLTRGSADHIPAISTDNRYQFTGSNDDKIGVASRDANRADFGVGRNSGYLFPVFTWSTFQI